MEWNDGMKNGMKCTQANAQFSDCDIIILDKVVCWQHWACCYSLCGEIRALDT